MTKNLIHSHYDLLGISSTASREEIADARAALRRLHEIRARHNDPAANQMLVRLNEAERVLLDEGLRAAYDRDPAVIARSFVDVAYSLPIGRFARLREVGAWLAETGRTALELPPVELAEWATPDPLLDGGAR